MQNNLGTVKSPIHLVRDGKPESLNALMQEEKPAALKQIDDAQGSVPHPKYPWHGFSVEFYSIAATRGALPPTYNPHPLIWYNKTGHSKAVATSGAYRHDSIVVPGSFQLLQERFEIDGGEFQTTPTTMMIMEIRPDELHRLFPDEVKSINLSGWQLKQDKNFEGLFSLIEAEIKSGCISGHLYAESLSIALIAYLIQSYTDRNPIRRIGGKLSDQNVQAVKSYVRENLSSELSIVELASLVHLSPYHFARLFKATMGMTPHNFVMEQRILEAQRLLQCGSSVTEVAYITGFSSQTHLSKAFRRRVGVSPNEMRRKVKYLQT